MTNLTKNVKGAGIDSNITEAFRIIDDYLPRHYTARVQEIIPECSSSFIRHVRCVRRGPAKVVAALRMVALEEKQIIS